MVKDKAEIRAGKGFKEDSPQSLGEALAEKKSPEHEKKLRRDSEMKKRRLGKDQGKIERERERERERGSGTVLGKEKEGLGRSRN